MKIKINFAVIRACIKCEEMLLDLLSSQAVVTQTELSNFENIFQYNPKSPNKSKALLPLYENMNVVVVNSDNWQPTDDWSRMLYENKPTFTPTMLIIFILLHIYFILLATRKTKSKVRQSRRLCVKQANDRIAVARTAFLTNERISVKDLFSLIAVNICLRLILTLLCLLDATDAEFGGTLNWRKDLQLVVDPCAATTVE
ncbi:hypothetical protein T4B_655 [Trichinella pseudospiralis]|uniref:Uncharacterized protein n=1 Tax=Trichinella pseudospiralis TaxID=6337 RepID=A0A0V1JIE6_TRIPS|nr:hypothetical protein T4B_655 [Trichinella pseudospiralis]